MLYSVTHSVLTLGSDERLLVAREARGQCFFAGLTFGLLVWTFSADSFGPSESRFQRVEHLLVKVACSLCAPRAAACRWLNPRDGRAPCRYACAPCIRAARCASRSARPSPCLHMARERSRLTLISVADFEARLWPQWESIVYPDGTRCVITHTLTRVPKKRAVRASQASPDLKPYHAQAMRSARVCARQQLPPRGADARGAPVRKGMARPYVCGWSVALRWWRCGRARTFGARVCAAREQTAAGTPSLALATGSAPKSCVRCPCSLLAAPAAGRARCCPISMPQGKSDLLVSDWFAALGSGVGLSRRGGCAVLCDWCARAKV